MTKQSYIALIGVLCLLFGGCWSSDVPPEALGTLTSAAIYGPDDRKEVYEHPDAKLRELSRSVGMLITSASINTNTQTGIVTARYRTFTEHIRTSTQYGGKPLCTEEAFRLQPQIGGCTVFLIAPNLVATAGHCVQINDPIDWCQKYSILFDHELESKGKPRVIKKEEVYRCKEVIMRQLTARPPIIDVAILKLDRDVTGRKPLVLADKASSTVNQRVALIGHPHGIYKKIASGGGKITVTRNDVGDYFTTSLDSYPGNSGSPVFDLNTYQVLGVHVRGKRPVFTLNKEKDCFSSTTYATDAQGAQSATYATHVKETKCTNNGDCPTKQEACLSGVCRPRSPDLRIAKMEIKPDNPKLGDTVTVSYEIVNAGEVAVYDSFFLGLWLSKDPRLVLIGSSDIELNATRIGPIEPGKSEKGNFEVVLTTPIASGRQYLGLYVDDRRSMAIKDNAGLIVERSEDNNAATLLLNVGNCQSNCPKVDERKCDKQTVYVCQRGANGCLNWQKGSTCQAPKACRDGICTEPCQDACQRDKRKCDGDVLKACKPQKDGCLNWQEEKRCGTDQRCDDKQSACVAKPPTPTRQLDQSCTSDAVCISGACIQDKGDETKRCRRKCQKHEDCKDLLGRGFCLGAICSPIPADSCLSDTRHNCTRFGSICKENRCLPKPGCGCHTSHRHSSPFPLLFLFLLLAMQRLYHRSKRA